MKGVRSETMAVFKRRIALLWISMTFLVVFAAGCGKEDYDLSVFIMPQTGMSGDMAGKLQASLQEKYGSDLKVSLRTSPLYSAEKLTVEIISKEHVVMIVTERDFKTTVRQGGAVPLEEDFDQQAYPSGVLQEHLYGIPMKNSSWLKSAGYNGSEMYAFIPANTPSMEQSKQMLHNMIEP
jgi:hypothetical protein